jgi:hypothetical protein
MTKNYRIAVIGSGHAALGACFIFTQYPDIQIDVIDIGLTSKYLNQTDKPILNAKSCHGSYFPYGLNDSRWPVTLESKRMCSSHAYGGFSNVYSGAFVAPRKKDLVYWPNESIPSNADFSSVLNHVGVIAANDCLETWSPLVSPSSRDVHRDEAFAQPQSFLGFSRIAVQWSGDGVNPAPYNTASAFSNFRERRQVNYTGATYVHSLIKTSTGVEVWVISDDKVVCFGEYDAVFLAAGCINTTGIAHRSCRPGVEGQYNLKSTAGFIQGFVGKGPKNSPELELRRRHNLPEMFLEIQDSAFSGYWSHTQISAVNRYVLETVSQRLPSLMVKKFHQATEKFYFALTNVPSILNTRSIIVCSANGMLRHSFSGDQIRIEESLPTNDVKWRQAVRTAIYNNGNNLNMSYIPGSEWLGNKLRGNQLGGWHFGGTLPMSENDDTTTLTCTPQGELRALPGVFIVDSAAFPSIPGTTVAFLTMAHASKVARQWVESRIF